MKWFKAIRLTDKPPPQIISKENFICSITHAYIKKTKEISAARLLDLCPNIYIFGSNTPTPDLIGVVVLKHNNEEQGHTIESIVNCSCNGNDGNDIAYGNANTSIEGYYRFVPSRNVDWMLIKPFKQTLTKCVVEADGMNLSSTRYNLVAVMNYQYSSYAVDHQYVYDIRLLVDENSVVIGRGDPYNSFPTNCGPLSQLWMQVANLWLGAIEGINQDDAKIVRQQLLSYRFFDIHALYFQRI
ncbi:MAG: hypothetical protein QXM92_02515 [Candidatus Anstonellales archaeon]